MDTITGQQQDTITSTLAVEVVDALYPQWSVNGHNIPAAFATVAEHTDPAIAHTASTTPLADALVSVLEAEFWQRARAERQALRA